MSRRASRTALTAAAALTGLLAPLQAPAAAASPRALPEQAAPAALPEDGRAAPGLAQAAAALRGETARLTVRLASGSSVRRGVAAAEDLEALQAVEAEPAQPVPGQQAYSVEVPVDAVEETAAALQEQTGVTGVRVGRQRWTHAEPSDALWSAQSPYLATVGAPEAWDVSRSSSAVRIAVVDSGVDVDHPDLAGKVVGRYNAVDGSSDVTDTVGHGTAVASVAAARTGNGTGIAGAGHDASILAVKVADRAGSLWSDDIARGIRWAADHGADVINLSLGSPVDDPAERSAVAYARSRGVILVASAGNEGDTVVQFPAAHPGVVSVGATNAGGSARTSWSTYGSWVDVAAPGQGIWAAVADGDYEQVSGTSFSAPLVAGEAALLSGAAAGASEAQLAAALTTATRGGGLGFARGVVDFRAAVLSVLPPTVTAPAAGAAVSGAFTVTAAAQAPAVRFSLPGQSAVTVPVVDGVATGSLETYGLAGAQTVRAVACSSLTVCAPGGGGLGVTVTNEAPRVSTPATEVRAATTSAGATAPGGAVRFTVDGRTVATDTTASYAAEFPVHALPDGPHAISALQCSRTASVCDTTHPATPVSFTVRRLHPSVVAATPSPISPNGDGVRESVRLDLRLERPQTLRIDVRDARGTTVVHRAWATLPAGNHAWVWDGRRRDRTFAADGRYSVELSTAAVVDGVSLRGSASVPVVVDRTAPTLSALPTKLPLFPMRDGYRDTVTVQTTSKEALSKLRLQVRDSKNRVVRDLAIGSRPAGVSGIAWDARDSRGSVVPAGTYGVRLTAVDTAGNVRVSAAGSVVVSPKKLVRKTAYRDLTALATARLASIGRCSEVFEDARVGWPGSFGYYSDYHCDSAVPDDTASVQHSFTLPAAVRYGVVRIDAFGGAADPAYPDTAVTLYHDRNGVTARTGTVLGGRDGWHTGPNASAATTLAGRTVTWTTMTTDARWYDVKAYRVAWSYDVLE